MAFRRPFSILDDPLLVRVLDGLTSLDEQIEAFLRGKVVLIAILGDTDAAHKFHHEKGPAGSGGSGVKNL